MAANLFPNLHEENWASETICGQANDVALQRTVTRPDNTVYTMPVALEKGKLIGMKSDGLWYLASAEAGAGQIPCMGINFDEAVNGQSIDVIDQPRWLDLGTAVSGATVGQLAYLSATVPGHVTNVAPVGTGKLVQVVGRFMSPTRVKLRITNAYTVL